MVLSVMCFCTVAVTPLGRLLFERLHHVTSSVGHMSQVALLFMSAYPLFDMTVSSLTQQFCSFIGHLSYRHGYMLEYCYSGTTAVWLVSHS